MHFSFKLCNYAKYFKALCNFLKFIVIISSENFRKSLRLVWNTNDAYLTMKLHHIKIYKVKQIKEF